MKQGIAHLVCITTLSCCVLFLNLGAARLWDRDEPRNAGCAREMMERGDWVTPIFNDELRDAKPVLLYWLIMSAYWTFGITEFAARFWSALLAVGTVLLTYGMGRRLYSAKAGFWAALALASSLMFVVAGRAATPDSVLIFCVTGSLACYVFGTFASRATSGNTAAKHATITRLGGQANESSDSSQAASETGRRSRKQRLQRTKRTQLPMDKANADSELSVNAANDSGDESAMSKKKRPANDWQVEGTLILKDAEPFPMGNLALLGMYGMMGLGMLAKGPVGVILPMAIIGMFMLIVRLPKLAPEQTSEMGLLSRFVWNVVRPFHPWHFIKTVWAMRPFTAIFMVLAVAGPWYILVGLRTEGDFLQGFFLKEHFGRATESFENHSGPIYYYPLAILAGFFPWSVFALPVLLFVDRVLARRGETVEGSADDLHQDYHPRRLATLFVTCWVLVWVGVFSIAQTKLPSYVTPCYPALALLVGAFLTSTQLTTSRLIAWWNRWAMVSLIVVGIGLAVGLPMVANRFLPGLEWFGAFGLLPLVGGLTAWICFARKRWDWGRSALAASALGFAVALFGFGTVALDRFQTNDQIFTAINSHRVSEEPAVASVGILDSTWVYYLEQPVYELTIGPAYQELSSEIVQAARDEREQGWLPKPRPKVEAFVAAHPDSFLITTESQYDLIRQQLPSDFEVLESTQHFLQDEQLLLLGRRSARVAEQTSEAGVKR